MLTILKPGERFEQPCALLLGGFDGLHVGHKSLLEAARATGLPVGITLFSGNKEGGELFTFAEREHICRREGISFAIELPFTDAVRGTDAASFCRTLFSGICAQAVICGEDFRFGCGAAGTPALLREFAHEVIVLPIFRVGGVKVGTAYIKRLLAEGRIAEANALLHGGYFICGRVEHGRRLGRQLGFPTLNLTLAPEKAPLCDGVYGGSVQLKEGTYPAIIHCGARPTFGVTERKLEAYLEGYAGDAYGEEAVVLPEEYYRPICRFPSAAALQEQLAADRARLISNTEKRQKERNV